jgi:YVTN family beta-propeller protein
MHRHCFSHCVLLRPRARKRGLAATPVTIPINQQPNAIVVSPDGAHTYVLMYGNSSGSTAVGIIDNATNTQVGQIRLRGDNYEGGIAISPDGATLYVADGDDGAIDIIDTASVDTASPVITRLTGFSEPAGIAASPDGSKVYVSDSGSGAVSIVSRATQSDPMSVTATLDGFSGPSGIAVSPDSRFVYVANSYDTKLSIIDTQGSNEITTVLVGAEPVGVAVSPDGKSVYITNRGSGTVSILDTTTNNVTTPLTGYSSPTGVAASPSGTNVLFTGTNRVTIINTVTGAVSGIDIVGSLAGIALSPDGARAYVANNSEGSVSVLDLATLPPAMPASAIVGSPYIFAIVSMNSSNFTVTSGSLPPGLTLNPTTGLITGTPTAAGTSIFTVTATGELNSDIRSYSLTVGAGNATQPAPPQLAATGLDTSITGLLATFSLLLVGIGIYLTTKRVRLKP